jgi:arylformamidase
MSTTESRLIDLSHAIEHGMVTLKGYPAPAICDYLSREAFRSVYAAGAEFHIGRIDMIANTGTYVDSPFHRYADGIDLAELPLERLADLVHTGHARHWGTDAYFDAPPFLTGEAAADLRDRGAVHVGIDSVNIDSMDDPARPVHSTLLAAGIPICEHVRGLELVPDSGFRFFAVPVKVKAFGTFPVRAFALLR